MAMGNTAIKAVIAVSGDTSPLSSETPSTDFWELARLLDAPVVGSNHFGCGAGFGALERATALDIRQAIRIVREHPVADIYVSFSERVGIPLGFLLSRRSQRPPHLMIAHRLNTPAKRLVSKALGWCAGVDRVVVLCSSQLGHAQKTFPGKAVFVRGGTVDNRFYTPADGEDDGYILSVGSEGRDYETLFRAISISGHRLKLLSSSPWSRKRSVRVAGIPEQVEILPRVGYRELRGLYQRARLVALPLDDLDYVAGHNGLLEAFCLNRAVVVSESCGIMDYVQPGVNACSVPVGDAVKMADAISRVSSDVALRSRLAAAGHACVHDYANLDSYARALSAEVRLTLEAR